DRAKAVVVLWSASSGKSNWVQDEAAFARDRQRLVPISIDGSEPPLGFRQLQCVDLSGGRLRANNPGMHRALQAIADMMDQPIDPAVMEQSTGIARRSLIAAGAAAGVAVLGYGGWQLLRPGRAEANTIAVLPFENLSGDAAKEYLSDGLAAELRSTLSRNPLLKVVGQASSNEFRDRKEGSKSISRQLGVANLVDGNVLAANGALRIGIELIDGDSGFSRWSNKFELPMGNILDVQDEIATAVGAALAVRLSDEAVAEAKRAVSIANQFPDAYAALGYALFYGKLDIISADGPYEKAGELGSGSADVLGLCAIYRARRRQFDRAFPAIERAASLDPLNPNVFKSRGRIKFAAGDYPAAIEAARRAIDLNPKIG